ncbi:MAG: hypothetical protein ABI653_04810, partial [Bacteroidota bacterium]
MFFKKSFQNYGNFPRKQSFHDLFIEYSYALENENRQFAFFLFTLFKIQLMDEPKIDANGSVAWKKIFYYFLQGLIIIAPVGIT